MDGEWSVDTTEQDWVGNLEVMIAVTFYKTYKYEMLLRTVSVGSVCRIFRQND